MNRPHRITLALAIASAWCAMSACSQRPMAARSVIRGKGHRAVREEPGSRAVGDPGKNAALQDFLNHNLGITLVMDDGTTVFGLLQTNKEGRLLATKGSPFGTDPGAVELVNVAGDDRWWRKPDADNAVVLIETLYTDENTAWRATAAAALGDVRTPDAVRALTTALRKDRDPVARMNVANALGAAGTPETVEALRIAAEKDPEPSVRDEAKKALRNFNTGR